MNLRIKSFEEYQDKYRESVEDPEQFWSKIAATFEWGKPWDTVLNWNFEEPKISWFEGAQLNITENLLDRHLETRSDQIAFLWEPNNPDDPQKSITYKELYEQVCKLSNGLRELGVQKGDRICIYMPMVLESVVAILACARIGAVHSIVFAGFSSSALADRINDAEAKVVITADGLNRGAKQVDLKNMVDEALLNCTSIEYSIVLWIASIRILI